MGCKLCMDPRQVENRSDLANQVIFGNNLLTWVQRAIFFGCPAAVRYLIFYTLALFVYDKATVELGFLKSRWLSVGAALLAAAAISFFAPAAWHQRLWPGWVVVVPIGALAVLTTSRFFTLNCGGGCGGRQTNAVQGYWMSRGPDPLSAEARRLSDWRRSTSPPTFPVRT
jgi:hypothetical protein